MYGIKTDDNGLLVNPLEKTLEYLKSEDEHHKLLYTVPDFQNPAGMTLCAERRKKIIELARKYNVFILEDLPYRYLRFEGKMTDPMVKTDNCKNTIGLFSFSKVLSPGFRLGYIVANEEIINHMVVIKQSVDLCTSNFIQLITNEFIKQNHYHAHVEKIKQAYKKKKDTMLKALGKYMPEGVTWTKPEGGMFLFVRLPQHMDADLMFPEAIKENVAYVVGSAFHCDQSGKNTMRLNFSFPTEEQIDEGIKRLASVIKKHWNDKTPHPTETEFAASRD
jgi:2-aminoadipate transaminase